MKKQHIFNKGDQVFVKIPSEAPYPYDEFNSNWKAVIKRNRHKTKAILHGKKENGAWSVWFDGERGSVWLPAEWFDCLDRQGKLF